MIIYGDVMTYKDLCNNFRLFERFNEVVDDANGGEDEDELHR